jgi:hypothetical protein
MQGRLTNSNYYGLCQVDLRNTFPGRVRGTADPSASLRSGFPDFLIGPIVCGWKA